MAEVLNKLTSQFFGLQNPAFKFLLEFITKLFYQTKTNAGDKTKLPIITGLRCFTNAKQHVLSSWMISELKTYKGISSLLRLSASILFLLMFIVFVVLQPSGVFTQTSPNEPCCSPRYGIFVEVRDQRETKLLW